MSNPIIMNEHSGVRPSIVQTAGGLLGILVILIGLVLTIWLFFKVVKFFNEPDSFKERLDKWELVVRGDVDPGPVEIKMREPAEGQSQTSQLPVESMKMPLNFARGGAVIFMIMVLGMMVRLAIAIMSAGGKLVQLANPWQAMYEKLRTDPPQHRTFNTAHRGMDSDSVGSG